MAHMLGRKPPHDPIRAPRLRVGSFLRLAQLPPVPPVIDWLSGVADWPMYGNDAWGDCVFAMIGHATQAFTRYGQGTAVSVTDADVLAAYSAVTGFNPAAGPPGNNPTDQGTVIQDALGYWRRVGIGGHKILAFAEVDIRIPAQVDAALYLFGHLMVGVNLPYAALDQFDAGQVWHLVSDDGGIAGGHAVNLGFYAGGGYKIVTWARTQPFSQAWWDRYVEEAWVVISPEWLSAAGASPAGVDVGALRESFTALTGKPFPDLPTPVVPGTDAADRELAAALRDWAACRHTGANARAARAFTAWRRAKGL